MAGSSVNIARTTIDGPYVSPGISIPAGINGANLTADIAQADLDDPTLVITYGIYQTVGGVKTLVVGGSDGNGGIVPQTFRCGPNQGKIDPVTGLRGPTQPPGVQMGVQDIAGKAGAKVSIEGTTSHAVPLGLKLLTF